MTKNLDIKLMVNESGMKYNEIARQMGITAGAFYARMNRGLNERDRNRVIDIIGATRRNKFFEAAEQIENITALDGGIDYGKRSKAQIKALDDAIDLAVAVLRREGKKDGELLD